MSEAWSTKTFRPSKSNTLSMPLVSFSKFIWYENPEQPPPTTPTRRARGGGSCWAIISLTLAMAIGVISSPIGDSFYDSFRVAIIHLLQPQKYEKFNHA